MPKASPSNCCTPLFIPPQKSPFAVFSFRDSIIDDKGTIIILIIRFSTEKDAESAAYELDILVSDLYLLLFLNLSIIPFLIKKLMFSLAEN